MRVFDQFCDARPAGQTIGTTSTSGAFRRGVDRERCISIDHGALRFQPLVRDGWDRQGLSYGPVAATPGIAFAVGLLNGHNTSQAGDLEQSFGARFRTWLDAGGTHRTRERLRRFLRSGRHRVTARQFWRWIVRAPGFYRDCPLDENLAVGLYDQARPKAPQDAEVGFVMHAAGPENGELWARVAGRNLAVLHGVQNVPLLLLIVQREGTATYYVASSEPAKGLPQPPLMRPVAVTPRRAKATVFPGIHQSALGQVGFRVDTRVYGVRAESWEPDRWTSFLLEDSLTLRDVDQDFAGAGAPSELSGSFERSERGIRCAQAESFTWRELSEPAGLVHVVVDESGGTPPALIFGEKDVGSAYGLQVEAGRVRLRQRVAGAWHPIAEQISQQPAHVKERSLLLTHDEEGVSVFLDGERVFDRPVPLRSLSGIGLFGEHDSRGHLRALEVHPRAVTIPGELNVPLPSVTPGSGVVVEERFAGVPGELEGRVVRPGIAWRKELGAARILIGGESRGAIVSGARHLTSRVRTVYTLPWDQPGFADLAVSVKPPGRERGEGEEGRAGVVFWQDADNYVIVGTWLHDHYGGASVSSFYCLRGFEDIYDAVWTNVGSRVRWGIPYELRVAFDGVRFTASLDGEAVLHRALSDVRPEVDQLQVRRVGIVANWEWGNDTGSEFQRFCARRRGEVPEQASGVRARARVQGVP